MNTKNKQDEKKQRRSTRQENEPKKQVRSPNTHRDHEQEHPETRLTR
jgi:hypothetical protein